MSKSLFTVYEIGKLGWPTPVQVLAKNMVKSSLNLTKINRNKLIKRNIFRNGVISLFIGI